MKDTLSTQEHLELVYQQISTLVAQNKIFRNALQDISEQSVETNERTIARLALYEADFDKKD
jgi:hypothetical protein